MTTSTFFSTIRSIPVVLGLFAAISASDVLAQHQPLPVTSVHRITSGVQNEAVPVYKQALSGDHTPLTKGTVNLSKPHLPVYVQRFTDSDKPLALGEVNVEKPARTIQAETVSRAGKALPVVASTNNVKKLTLSISVGPLGTPDSYAVPSDKTLSIAAPGFLANDIDLNGEALTAVAIVMNVSHGTLAAFGNGSFTYTPTAGYTGPDAFQYRMRDASGILSDPVDVSIQVLPPANRTPVGSPDAYTALSGTALSIAAPGFLANDIDPDGETITAIAIVSNVSHGSLAAFGNGSFTYTPTSGFIGTDAFQYRMRDASGHLSDPVVVTINVVEGNRPPIGIADQYTAVINTALSIAAPGFLANDVDPDGDAITAIAIVSNVTHGSLAAFGNGSFTYTPSAGYTGPDAFSYRMRDAVGHVSDPVNVTINVSPAGTLPVGTPDSYGVPSDKTLSIAAPGFLANDIDLNGEALTAVAIVMNVSHGTLAAFGNGSFTYTPTAGYTGPDAFQYRMKDASNNLSDPVTVSIEVLPPSNRTPIGSPDVYTALSGTALSIAAPGFLANDIDPDGETITAIAIVSNVTHGSLAAFGNGSFTYTPTSGFIGTDAFQYRMRDASNHLSDPVDVTINVVEGNRPPIGIADQYTAVINTALSIAAPGFLANDLDPDGDAITAVAIVSNVTHGALAAFGNGSFTYTPSTGYTGPDAFSYRMKDAVGHVSDPVNVTIDVVAPNRPPVADAGSDQTVDCDGSGGATVTLDGSGSTDPDNDALTYTWRENGNIIAGPTTDTKVKVFLSLGVHNIELTVDDGAGHTATDNVTIKVADITPPTVTAAFVPKPDDHEVFTVSCSSSDACDKSLKTSSIIVLPQLNNPQVKFQVKKSEKLMIDMAENKVLVQAPDPQSFWNGILAAGGISVIDGQSLSLTYNKDEYAFIFDKNGNLRSVEGPIIVLRCTATDGSGNTTVSEAIAPIAPGNSNYVMKLGATDNTVAAGVLDQNYPNPFKYKTVIGFNLAKAGAVRLAVYDSKGQLVQTLVDAVMANGHHQVMWNAHNLPAGIYYYRVYTGSFVEIRKMILLK